MSKSITSYKAFNDDWTCRGFQFEVGKSYTHDGEVKACYSGFHGCENPFDILNYYSLTESKFAEVTHSGNISRDSGVSKLASGKITIEAELKLPDFVARCVGWLLDNAKERASGNSSQLAASGNSSQLAASGNSSQLAASGNSSQLAASGNSSQLAASGNSSKLAASGNYSQLAASGNYSQLAASGNSSKLAASGNYSQLAASGRSSQLAASGNYSQLAASGNYSKLAASGNYSQLAASGRSSQLAASGHYSVIASSSVRSKAKGGKGTWISLASFDGPKCIGFATGCIGENGLKPDVWYKAENGKLVAA